MDLIAEMSKYILLMEGFTPGLPSWHNNNPGNINAVGNEERDAQGFRIRKRMSEGFRDLEDLIEIVILKHQSVNMVTFFAGERDEHGAVIPGGYPGYAPARDPRGANKPVVYAKFVAKGIGIAVDVKLFSKLPVA